MNPKHLSVFAVLLLFFITPSCKKGEEDPAMSLLSRKARLSGEWKLSSINSKEENDSPSLVFNTTIEGTGEQITVSKELHYDDGSTLTGTETQTINEYSLKINKDGSWERYIDYDFVSKGSTEIEISEVTGGTKVITKGTWAFAGKTKGSYKNKERLILTVTEDEVRNKERLEGAAPKDGSFPMVYNVYPEEYIHQTYEAHTNVEIYELVMLKSKEMKWKATEGFVRHYNESLDGIKFSKVSNLEIVWIAE